MALVLANRVQETGTANTTVSFTLAGAVTGFQSFAVIGNTNTTYYSATDGSGNWEVGLGTYSTTGPTLTRTTIYASSNSNLAVTFSGAVNVFVTYPSGQSVNLNESGNVSALGTVSSGTWQGTTVGVAYGGTGVTSSSGANSVVLRDANQNITINRINQGLQTTTASGGITTLTVASQFNQALVGTGGHTFKLPDATTLSDTTAFQFNNNATGTLTITNNAGTTVGTVASGGAAGIALLDNTTSNGTWDVHAYIPENVTWGANALALGSTVITGGTWQGGTIQPAYGGTGLTTFTGANNALYSTGATTLTAGTLPMVAGGTGLSTIASTRIPYATATDTLGTSSGLTFNGSTFSASNINSSGSLTVTGTVTFNATSSAIQVSPSQNTTTITIGGTTSATGTITLGRSTVSQTTAIQAGATASGSTKTINFGTGGLAGSTTTMAIGSTNGTTVTANGTWDYTGAITSTNASGILTRAAATQDGVHIYGRAGGTGNFEVAITPTTLSADRTLTLPDTSGTVITSGDTGTVTSTMILDGTIVNADINASAAIAVSKLAASTISGVTLGSTLATLTMNTSGTGISGSTTYNGSGAATFTVTSNATNANTASTIVARDASGNFSAGTITATLSGNASTATSATSAGSVTNSVTFNNGGAGGASGSTFNGSGALTVSYNTVGAPSTTGTNASGTWGINISGNAATATTANALNSGNNYSVNQLLNNTWYNYNDNDRNAGSATYYPNASTRAFRLAFVNASSVGTGGNYAGLMQFNPWDGTTASTGDASYQMAWGSTAANSGGIPQLNIRKGIDTTWNSWYTILHSGNYNSYAPTLTGTGASGTWGINISGNAATATTASSASSVAWGNVTSKPSNIMYYQSFTLDANTMDSNATGFTYSVNAPYTGPIVRFSTGGGYDLWLNAIYNGGGYGLAFRTRNGDTATFNSWQYPAVYGINANGGGALYATIYYDQNNTSYYVDPNGTTSLRTVGDWRADSSSWTGEFAGKIQYHSNNWYFQYTTEFIFRNAGGSNVFYGDSSGNTFASGSNRAPIFYDNNNTAYYTDPASTSQLNVLACAGNITSSGTIAASSDERLKTNWRDLPANFVELLAKVKSGVYDRVDEEGLTQVGVSAQSLLPVLPDAVVHNADGMLGVAYGNAALVAAVKLAEKVLLLEQRIKQLEGST